MNPNDYMYACIYTLLRAKLTHTHKIHASFPKCLYACVQPVNATRAWASIAMHTLVHIRRTCMLHRSRCTRSCASVCSQPVTSTLMPLRVSLCPCCFSFCYFGGMKLAVSQSTGYQPAHPTTYAKTQKMHNGKTAKPQINSAALQRKWDRFSAGHFAVPSEIKGNRFSAGHFSVPSNDNGKRGISKHEV